MHLGNPFSCDDCMYEKYNIIIYVIKSGEPFFPPIFRAQKASTYEYV